MALVGIGNRFRGDDAIGLNLVDALSRDPDAVVETHCWEDADALTVAHELIELDRPALIVDCADMGLAAGEYRFFSEESIKGRHTLSTHGLGMAEAINVARAGGFCHRLRVMGVQPHTLEHTNQLSPELKAHFETLLEALRAELLRTSTEVVGDE